MWKLSRQQLRPQFHYKQYENLTVFDQAIDNLLQAIARSQTDKGVTDLQPHFFNFTLDTTTAFLFGKDIQSLLRLCLIQVACAKTNLGISILNINTDL